jgi:hypothetical protein
MKEPLADDCRLLYAVLVIGVGGHRLVGALEEWCYCCTVMRCVSCCYEMLL